MSLSFASYATDEDVAVRAPGDYSVLCPAWQTLSAGGDGVFAGGSPWVLSSASAGFSGQGAAAGHVVLLSGPKPQFKGTGLLFAVDSAAAGSVTLRNVGMPSGVGNPPGPFAGLTGVSFTIPHLTPQIESACLEANHEFGLDPNLGISNPGLLYDPARELAQFVVLTVLRRLYADAKHGQGDFAEKLKQASIDLSALRSRVTVRFGTLGESELPKNQFSTQVRR